MKAVAGFKKVPSYTIKTKEMKAAGFDILSLEGSGGREYDSTQPHRHNFFEILYFAKGGGAHEIDFQKLPLTSDSVHFVSPGQIHHLSLRGAKGFVVCFTEDLVNLGRHESFTDKFPFLNGNAGGTLLLNKELSSEINWLVQKAKKDLKNNVERRLLFSSYLNIILLKLNHQWSELYPGKKTGMSINGTIAGFRKLVSLNYAKHLPLTQYAVELNVSPNYLNALCRKHLGSSAIQLIQQRLLLEAKRLLAATDLSVKEISFTLEFTDVAYFTRFFKKHAGLPPQVYRLLTVNNR